MIESHQIGLKPSANLSERLPALLGDCSLQLIGDFAEPALFSRRDWIIRRVQL